MNSDDLELFSRVARTRSISRAALETGINQSTVSRRITMLETELGVRLFRRSGRGVTLTERGQVLLAYAATMEKTLEEATRTLRNSSELGPAQICIAAQPTVARIMFGALRHELGARYPQTRVRFVEGLASQLLGMLQDGKIDIGIMYVPEQRGALQYDLLFSERVCLITPPDYPLRGDSINVSELANIPLILPSTHHGLRLLVESLAAREGFTPKIALECDGSISITKRLVLANCGCSVLPAAAVVEEVAAGRLKSFRLDNPAVERDVAIVWSQNSSTSGGLWDIAQIIRDTAATLVRNNEWPGTAASVGRPDSPTLVKP
ncbi:transcriptional regulator, LysR family [Paraburkholderia fungorum]|uniref:Transcriptional regulator, LysR family n=1 Tax=Paraburkholderia fungorum TaxID=134537 RepID=A0A1H1JDS8_9BURK|nr:LysR family transcriptional regulator [Paraburkholderia fungorum]SDR48081.1 transcriptional regulator, LysR family [Paraburkholderia fungorum]